MKMLKSGLITLCSVLVTGKQINIFLIRASDKDNTQPFLPWNKTTPCW
jgi:hypothetical protein